MATLTNLRIQDSYQGLIKVDDNGIVDPTVLKQLTDGTGGSLPIQVSQVQTKFQSLVDFTGATISGLPDAGGLNNGVGTDSLISTITSNPGIADGAGSIAIGQGANTGTSSNSISLGVDGSSTGGFSNSLGVYSEAGGNYATSLGSLCNASGNNSLAVGKQASASNQQSISIGTESTCSNANGIAIGYLASATALFGSGSVAIGWNVKTYRDAGVALGRSINLAIGDQDHYRPITIGSGGNTRGGDCIGIGTDTNILGTGTHNKIAIGTGAVCNDVTEAVALGAGVTATKASTVSVKELETVVAGGGITMYSPNGTEYKLTVSDAGALVITAA